MCKYEVFRELQEFDLIKPRDTRREMVGDVVKVSWSRPYERLSWIGIAQDLCFGKITPSQVEGGLETNQMETGRSVTRI